MTRSTIRWCRSPAPPATHCCDRTRSGRNARLSANRLATDAELAAYADAWPRYEATADAAIAAEGDVSLRRGDATAARRSLGGDVEAWEGPVICAVDADQFSARDWRRNALSGSNLVPEGGIGAFVQRRLTRDWISG